MQKTKSEISKILKEFDSKKHPFSKNFSKKLLMNFVLFLFVIILFIFFMEISIRLFTDIKPDKEKTGNLLTFVQKLDNPELGYELIPNKEGYEHGAKIKINSHGLRDIEYSLKKPENTYRIAVIGDSITFGWGGVELNETYTKILEEILNNESESNIEVLNFGVPGYVGSQEFYVLKNKVLDFNPDLIIIGHYLNDPDKIWNLFETASKLPVPIKNFLAEKSYFYVWLREKITRIKNKVGIIKFTPYKQLYEIESDYWINHKIRFQKMNEISKEESISILVVLLPDWQNLDDTYIYKNETELLNITIVESGLFSLDVFPKIKGLNPEDYKITPEDVCHPNYKGHKLIAQIIAERLEDPIFKIPRK
jgi:lysophospholipase L1-like esterase